MEELKELIDKKVEKLFLVVWPPFGEEKELDIDISFGLVFHHAPDRLCIITTDKDDMWTPCLRFENIPDFTYPWSEFTSRMDAWMKSEEVGSLETEYYDISEAKQFRQIVSCKIQSIELIRLESNPEPFGVKIVFDDDYIISTPISDGNTVETSHFHRNENIANFENMGILEFKELQIR